MTSGYETNKLLLVIFETNSCSWLTLIKITVTCNICHTFLCLLFMQINHDEVEEWIQQGSWCSSRGAEHKPNWLFLAAHHLPQ